MFKLFAETVNLGEKLDTGVQNLPRGEFQLQTILNTVYAIMGMVAVVTIIYNAVVYLTSQGEPGTTKKATQGILFSVIGLAIILVAALLTNFIFVTVGEAQK